MAESTGRFDGPWNPGGDQAVHPQLAFATVHHRPFHFTNTTATVDHNNSRRKHLFATTNSTQTGQMNRIGPGHRPAATSTHPTNCQSRVRHEQTGRRLGDEGVELLECLERDRLGDVTPDRADAVQPGHSLKEGDVIVTRASGPPGGVGRPRRYETCGVAFQRPRSRRTRTTTASHRRCPSRKPHLSAELLPARIYEQGWR